jgi:Xaa-Pro aminopeptidase
MTDTSPSSPHWSDSSWLTRYPQLSLAERDRRFRCARELMEAEDLDCLVLASPSQAHDFLGHYFANEATPTVVIPREGNPVAFQDGVVSATARRDLELSQEVFADRWIADWRLNEGAKGIARLLGHLDLADARIGCTGRKTMWPTAPYLFNGGAPWTELPITHQLSSLLPNAGMIDIWSTLLPLIAVKSAAEIEQFKKAAHLSERVTRIFFDHLEVGGTEADAMAQVAFDLFKHGAYTPSGGTPFALPRPLTHNTVVNAEIITFVGGIEVQSCMTACMSAPTASQSKLIESVQESYRLGRAAIKPGLSMRELDEVMAEPNRKIGASSWQPMFHGLNPLYTQTAVGRYGEADFPGLRARFFPGHNGALPSKPMFAPDTKLVPGMTIHFEPHALIKNEKAVVGATLLVTEDGVEEFGDGSTRVHYA